MDRICHKYRKGWYGVICRLSKRDGSTRDHDKNCPIRSIGLTEFLKGYEIVSLNPVADWPLLVPSIVWVYLISILISTTCPLYSIGSCRCWWDQLEYNDFHFWVIFFFCAADLRSAVCCLQGVYREVPRGFHRGCVRSGRLGRLDQNERCSQYPTCWVSTVENKIGEEGTLIFNPLNKQS